MQKQIVVTYNAVPDWFYEKETYPTEKQNKILIP